jgi:phospholipid-translocating ATPase
LQFQALVVFLTTICAYSDEKSEIEELSMVALSGCIWLQAFVVTLDTNSFTYPQIILIWGNFIAFYMINLIVSAVPTLQMYTIMFRLCSQPSYWITMGVSLLFFYDTIVVNHDLLLQPNLTLPQTIW